MNETSKDLDNHEITTSLIMQYDDFEACIEQLKLPSESRSIKRLIPYLETLTPFIQVLKNDINNYQNLLKRTATIMKHESKKVNQLIIRYGDKGSQFYVILSGKIAILTLTPTTYYLTDIEYICHLLKLRQNEEMEVIRQCIQQNNRLCPFEENFDQWMKSITQSKESQFGKDIPFSDSSEVRHMVEKTLYYLKLNKDKADLPSMTIEKYVRMNQVDNCHNRPEGRKPFEIFHYQLINQIETGQTFGNVALESKTSRRTASLITLQPTELAVIDKAEYDLLIKVVSEKAKKKFYSLIYSYSIFQELSKVVFEKKYFHLFVYRKIERGEKLIVEGERTENAYFLIKGEFELVSRRNMVEVNSLIVRLKQLLLAIKRKQDPKSQLNREEEFDEEKENEDLINNKQYRQPEHNKVLFEKKTVKLGVIQDRDIIGLIGCVEPRNKLGLITCSCVSFNSEVYSIPLQSFDMIVWNEDFIRPDLRQFQANKIDYLIQRLYSHKELVSIEIAKIDLDVSKMQKKEYEMQKSRAFKNRLYHLEANSIFNSNRNVSKPKMNTQILPVIMSNTREGVSSNELRSNDENEKATKMIKRIKIKGAEFKSPKPRNKKRCLFFPDSKCNILQQNLYNNLFHSYLKSDEFKQAPRSNSVKFCLIQQNTSKNASCINKEIVMPYKHKNNYSEIPVNVIDCLIMDKFNNCYSTALRNITNENMKKS